jgi:hypothetical protein
LAIGSCALLSGLSILPADGTAAIEVQGERTPAPAAPVAAPNAQAVPVSLGDVTSVVDAKKTNLPDAARLLRKDLEAEIAAFDWTKAKASRPYRVSVDIVELGSTANGKLLQASCTVSVAIRETKRGALLTTLVSRAKAEDAPSGAIRAERAALAAAARKAIAGVAQAISRAP